MMTVIVNVMVVVMVVVMVEVIVMVVMVLELHSHLSARTMRVLVTFSMVNFVLPPLPAILPMARDR